MLQFNVLAEPRSCGHQESIHMQSPIISCLPQMRCLNMQAPAVESLAVTVETADKERPIAPRHSQIPRTVPLQYQPRGRGACQAATRIPMPPAKPKTCSTDMSASKRTVDGGTASCSTAATKVCLVSSAAFTQAPNPSGTACKLACLHLKENAVQCVLLVLQLAVVKL